MNRTIHRLLTQLLQEPRPNPGKADAWDAGYHAALDDQQNRKYGIHYRTPNPYRSAR